MSIVSDLIPPRGPVRVLAVSNLVRTIGTGLLMTVGALFFTRSAGLTVAQVGVGITVASLVGALASVPAGHVADVMGARNTTVVFAALQGLAMCAYAFIGGFAVFIVIVGLMLTFESAAGASRGALVAAAAPPGERVRARAYLRSIANLGTSLGALLGGAALFFDTRSVYIGALWLAGLMCAAAALIYLRLDDTPPVPKPAEGPRLMVLRDRPVAAIALIAAILAMNNGLLQVVLPLWIAARTNAPLSVYAVVLLINTITVVLFQVRVSRGVEQIPSAARAHRRAGVLLAVACALWAASAGQPAWVAVTALLAGAVAHVFAELLFEAGTWTLSYDLAPEHAHGQYQGLFGTAEQVSWVLTPAVATAVIITYQWPGWMLFAGLAVAAGCAGPPITRWAQRTRDRYLHQPPKEELVCDV